MNKTFYKSLDREINIFGLRGGWVKIFLIIVGCSLFLALLLGAMTSTGVGFSIFIIGLAGGFISCLVLQQKMPSRQIDKVKIQSKMKGYIVRRETLSRIILEDPRKKK